MTATSGAGAKSRKGPRPKHQPQRTCVACRDKTTKRSLFRIVRTGEGVAEVDLTGKKSGRGAYLCDNPECWSRALESNVLNHALKTELTPEVREKLRSFAVSIFPATRTSEERVEGEKR